MNVEVFNEILEEQLENSRRVLSSKAKEYASGDDRLHNFKFAAKMDGHDDPVKALKGMDAKHRVSIHDIQMMTSKQRSKLSREFIQEKFGDHINYMILCMALILEEITNEENAERLERKTERSIERS